MALFFCLSSQTAFAFSESDAQAQVDAAGREAVSGNVLVWFLCAIAFLKVSQKIDSFMSSLGVNVGHTGGSMIAEAMIAARGVGAVRNFPATVAELRKRLHLTEGGDTYLFASTLNDGRKVIIRCEKV